MGSLHGICSTKSDFVSTNREYSIFSATDRVEMKSYACQTCSDQSSLWSEICKLFPKSWKDFAECLSETLCTTCLSLCIAVTLLSRQMTFGFMTCIWNLNTFSLFDSTIHLWEDKLNY